MTCSAWLPLNWCNSNGNKDKPVVNSDTTIPKWGHPEDMKTREKYAKHTGHQKLDVLETFYKDDKLSGLPGYGSLICVGDKKSAGRAMDYKIKRVVGYLVPNGGPCLDQSRLPSACMGWWQFSCAGACAAYEYAKGFWKYLTYPLLLAGCCFTYVEIPNTFYLTPRGRKNHHYQLLLELEHPQTKGTCIAKMHADLAHQNHCTPLGGGIEIVVLNGSKDAVLNDKFCGKKIHNAKVDITFFELLERFMRYRVKVGFLRGILPCCAQNFTPVEGSRDYICQDVVIDALKILGLHEGRSHWDGLWGITAGFFRAITSVLTCQAPGTGWFKNIDDFEKKFLLNKDKFGSVKKLIKKRKPLQKPVNPGPNQPSGSTANPGSVTNPKDSEKNGWSWITISLILSALAIIAFGIYYFFFATKEDDDEDFMDALERIRAEKSGNERVEHVSAVPFVYKPPAKENPVPGHTTSTLGTETDLYGLLDSGESAPPSPEVQITVTAPASAPDLRRLPSDDAPKDHQLTRFKVARANSVSRAQEN